MELVLIGFLVVLAVAFVLLEWKKRDEVDAYGRALDEVLSLQRQLRAAILERDLMERELAAVRRHRARLQEEIAGQ